MGLFQTLFTTEELRQRRERVCQQIGQTAIAVLQGADASPGMTAFRQYNDSTRIAAFASVIPPASRPTT